ncbi:MAG: DNA topoisomerase IV subunit A [Waddliaceae bacterium]|jgi:topoisomerase IV subunit A|nr:DNA topoisomerase IV subunit A [Waddliaceae bacterium]MBT3579089.1 DNA topoisomerase IV subunit A [Waddliaceae bacterium]MBT6928496.1 DNA topoisomerase IV subunit A [Waddliaceae bacterium]MBT7264351.1 DNA topoisomerase IV subunit A [Waddliaceae bacterium]
MEDLKKILRKNYITYASYVILDRAIPSVDDGLKPVQRRILHTLHTVDNGTFHKVANIVGQTMAFHPHGDAAINDALVNIANKGFLLDRQGNFGNIYSGDSAAAARYIETRLSPLARDTLFNKDLTSFVPSYDSRNVEPVALPSKIPLVLIQGAEGIAVGMSTKIMPHNFVELLDAEIAILEGEDFEILPDFLTGGIMDASDYDKGRGKIRLRASVETPDDKTIVIKEICYGTTTESLIRSIEEAAKKGKIKVDTINDYTTDDVEIEIKLSRGHYSTQTLDALYAFTDCEVSISPQCIVIKEQMPWETNVDEILRYHTNKLKEYLKEELEIERDRILKKIFDKTLERIFIENKLYKKIESIKTYEGIITAIKKALVPYHSELSHKPDKEDIERLLAIPIRRISRFDIDKNLRDIAEHKKKLASVERDLRNIKRCAIRYLKSIITKYGDMFPRRTAIDEIATVDKRVITTHDVKVYYDAKSGFLGTKISSDDYFECTNLDKILIMYKDGAYTVINIPEKQYILREKNPIAYIGIADKTTQLRVIFRDAKTRCAYAKSFIVKKFIIDREYRYFEEGAKLDVITTAPDVVVELHFKPKPRQKIAKMSYDVDSFASIKSVTARGIRLANKEVKKVKVVKRKTR